MNQKTPRLGLTLGDSKFIRATMKTMPNLPTAIQSFLTIAYVYISLKATQSLSPLEFALNSQSSVSAPLQIEEATFVTSPRVNDKLLILASRLVVKMSTLHALKVAWNLILMI